jgi:hypothetical protein
MELELEQLINNKQRQAVCFKRSKFGDLKGSSLGNSNL